MFLRFCFFRIQKDVRDIFTPVQFEVSYIHRETTPQRGSPKTFPPLKPILQQSAGHQNIISSQVPSRRNITSDMVVLNYGKYFHQNT